MIKGDCKTVGSDMVIERPDKNSPLLINELEKPEEIIKYFSCKDINDELDRVVESIKNDIFIEKLKADDIIVIALVIWRDYKKYFDKFLFRPSRF